MNFEEIIKLWKELGIESCTMEFSCGGDSMNDYNFKFYGDGKEIDAPEELRDYFDSEVFREVNFYECSDGHYIGEFGEVEITLEDDDDEEPRFSYDKQATSEWSERREETYNFELTEKEMSFIKEKVDNLNGGSWGDTNVNYKVDCIITDEEEEMINNLMERIEKSSEEYEFEDESGESDEDYQWTSNDDGEIVFEDNSIKIQVVRNFLTTTPSED